MYELSIRIDNNCIPRHGYHVIHHISDVYLFSQSIFDEYKEKFIKDELKLRKIQPSEIQLFKIVCRAVEVLIKNGKLVITLSE